MNTIATSFRRITAIAAATSFAAITTTFAAQPAPAAEPDSERPCFIAQPRWNDAFGGPAPTCPTPTWQRATEEQHTSTAWTRPRAGFDDFRP
jgi:hypothetical protein